MKYYLVALGMLAASPVMAQHEGHSFEHSAFQYYDVMKPAANEAVLQTRNKVQSKFPGWQLRTDRISGSAVDIYGKSLSLPGGTLAEKANNCMSQYLDVLGIDAAEWQQTRNLTVAHASFVDFDQWINGHKVIFSNLSFRFTAGKELQRIKIKDFGEPETGLAPSLDKTGIMPYLVLDLNGLSISAQKVENDWVWFPVPQAGGYQLRPSWPFHISGVVDGGIPQELSGYADAITGEILYRYNEVAEAFDVTVKANVKKNGFTQASSDEPLPNLKIRVGTTNYFTDLAGIFNNASLTAPVNAVVYLEGKWSNVRALDAPGDPTPTDTVVFNNSGTNYVFPVTPNFELRHANAYYHVDKIHDFMKGYLPTFTGMDYSLTTNVDNSGNTCNAFYTSSGGSSINFYKASGCPSFAEIYDIIYHEYGHGINASFYSDMGKGRMFNGALNEGHADVWGMSITKDKVLGKGAMGGTTSSIRRYDGAPKVYPQDIKGEVHADGEIIAGAWADVADNINSWDTMTQIFTKTFYDTPDGPSGTEGEIYHDVLISALMNDDNDNNLGNGTPHFSEIVTAFARHGIYLLSGATLTHTELDHQPIDVAIPVTADLVVSEPLFFDQLVLFYKNRGAQNYDSVIMTNNGNGNFSAQIPAQNTMGTILDYYFGVYDILNSGIVYFPQDFRPDIPADQSTLPYQFGLGIAKRVGTDFEDIKDTQDWEIGGVTGDNATSGVWVQEAPIESAVNSAQGSLVCQPGFDHTSASGMCLVTGNAFVGAGINVNDVDNGKTTAMTPYFDLSYFANPIIEYYRWFSNDRGSNKSSDWWTVQIHNENSFLWKNVDYTKQSDYNWRRRIFHVTDYVTKDRLVQVRFVASDLVNSSQSNNGESTVEAAVDDFFIYDYGFPTSVGMTTEELKAKVYPNPANNNVNITLSYASEGTIGIYDLMGKEVVKVQMSAANNKYTMDTKQLVPGTYMIIVQTDKTIQTQKLTVAH